MAYQVIQDFYLMGPTGRLGAFNFAMKRGFIFDTQRRYRAFFEAFIGRGRMRRVKARPTHIFKEGDFRPVSMKDLDDGGAIALKPEVKKLMEETQKGLPQPLEKMNKTWLLSQKKAQLVRIASVLGVGDADEKTIDQLVRVIINIKEQARLGGLPPAEQKGGTYSKVEEMPAGMLSYGDEDKIK